MPSDQHPSQGVPPSDWVTLTPTGGAPTRVRTSMIVAYGSVVAGTTGNAWIAVSTFSSRFHVLETVEELTDLLK